MSNKVFLATFERKANPLDYFSGETDVWELVAKEWVSLRPLNGREIFQAQQVQSIARLVAETNWSPSMSVVNTACRMKIAKPVPVDESDANADVNYRLFEIDSVVNVNEANRELQFMVVEKT